MPLFIEVCPGGCVFLWTWIKKIQNNKCTDKKLMIFFFRENLVFIHDYTWRYTPTHHMFVYTVLYEFPPSCDTPCSIACQVATHSHNYLLEEKFCLDLNSALVFLAVECFDSVALFTETIPFFPNDVISTFEPLVGAWASTGIVFQQASGCPVGGRGWTEE